ncbi:MAG: hypothetical protein A2277_18640 [Desulfobacterales bacterium RIFOXYA12_FULL_46_15]|nr:MAG: hypothetical protein A2097_08740 [Desulfobacula sp. GWF2_41_7]OGR28678.1 MAG: hypothetical protein A2277_18640 [Desulfobacterales bacterium RIFOXYA12_FULL_46_15]
MQHPFLKVIAFFSILAAIILFCIILGGYSSFYRSQNRIESSKTALVESCRERLALLPDLSRFMTKHIPSLPSDMVQINENLNLLLMDVLNRKLPLEEKMTKDFEASQTDLTIQINKLFSGFKDVFDPENKKEFESLKQKFLKAQDNLYIAGDRYNYEVSYFNMRINSFPVSLIGKLFGFNKVIYYPFSEQAFLPARKAFEP